MFENTRGRRQKRNLVFIIVESSGVLPLVPEVTGNNNT